MDKEKLIAGFILLSVELSLLATPVLLVSAIFMLRSFKSADYAMFGMITCGLVVGMDIVCKLVDATLTYMTEE